MSEAEIQNYSTVPHGIEAEWTLYTGLDQSPEVVLDILREAAAQARAIILKDDPLYAPEPRYRGPECVGGRWVAHYVIGYRVKILPKKSAAVEQLASFVWQRFGELDIPRDPANGQPIFMVPEVAKNRGCRPKPCLEAEASRPPLLFIIR